MKKYEIINPFLVFSVKDGTTRKEYALKQGETVELPETDITVRALLARKQIREVAESTAETAGSKKK